MTADSFLTNETMSNSPDEGLMMEISEGSFGFGDDLLEEKIFSEINRAYSGVELELVGVLDMQWRRVKPDTDSLPFDFQYRDQTSPHVLITAKCLVNSDGDLVIMNDAFLYVEASLAATGEAPQATPDYFKDLSYQEIDLANALDPDIRDMLLDLAHDDHSEHIAKLVSAHEDCDQFIATILDVSVRQAIEQRWKQQRPALR